MGFGHPRPSPLLRTRLLKARDRCFPSPFALNSKKLCTLSLSLSLSRPRLPHQFAMLLPPNLLPATEMEEALIDDVDIGRLFWKDYRKLSVKKDSLRNLLDRFYTEESQLTIAIHGKRIFHTARGLQGIGDFFTIMPEVGYVEFYDDKACRSIQSWEGGYIVTVPGYSSNKSLLRMLFIARYNVPSETKMFIVNDMFHVFEVDSCLTVGGSTERVTEAVANEESRIPTSVDSCLTVGGSTERVTEVSPAVANEESRIPTSVDSCLTVGGSTERVTEAFPAVANEESRIPTSDSSGRVRDLPTTVADLDLGRLTSESTGQVGHHSPEPSGLYSGVEPCGFETWIYVGNLPPNITSRELVELFTQFGRVNEPSISPIRKADGFCYCFVEFDSTIAVNQAIKASPLSFKGRQIHVRGRTFSKEKLIYVGNLFPGATTADVEHILKEFGSIRTANTSIHTQNNGFTFAITELDTVAAAEKAIEASFLRIGNRTISIRRRTSGAPSRSQQRGN